MTCVGEPISWLRLEQHALGASDGALAEHLAGCPACRACLDEIRDDLVALPPLAVPAPRARPAWHRWRLPAFASGLALAAALVLVLVRRGPIASAPGHGELLAGIKGVGDVSLLLVRERAGAIREDVTTFARGDRWKVVVTCAAADGAWIDVAVLEVDATRADRPVAPAHVACGNAVAVPGAFELTGAKRNRVCVRVSAERMAGDPEPGVPGVACTTISAE